MKYVALLSTALSACLPALAHAVPAVYPGCAVPATPQPGHHTFYVDPVKGSPKGDGSAAKPWRTLAEVLNYPSKLVSTQVYNGPRGTGTLIPSNANGPIKAGDVIMLMSGNHGDVFLQYDFNKDFITVMAAPGQTPVLTSLKVQSSQKWLFQGLKIVSGTDKALSTIVSFPFGDWAGTSNNLILDNSTVETVDSTSGWSDTDWMSKPKNLGVGLAASCMSLTNNHILNVVNGIGIGSTQTLIQGNKIEQMLNDGIDVTSSNVTIKSNRIENGANLPASQLHSDGIQGWSPTVNGVVQTVSNVVIDSNTLLKTGSGTSSYMQGISIFDGKWNNLTITNNSVAVNTWNGIVITAPSNSRIINNTVYGTDPTSRGRLSIASGKDKSLPSNTVVRNNITQELVVVGNGMTFDHNIAEDIITTGTAQIKNGTTGNANVIKSTIASGFMTINTNTKTFDLRLRSGSPAIGAGDAVDAPKVDILGKTRTTPVDAGAYAH